MCVCRCAARTCGDCFVRTRARVATRTRTDWVCEHTSVGCVHECARLGAQHAAAWVLCVHSTALCRVRVQQMRCTCVQSSARARSAGSGSQGAPRRVRSVLGTHSVCTNVEQVCVWHEDVLQKGGRELQSCSTARAGGAGGLCAPPALCPVWVNLNTVVPRGGLRAALCPPSTDPAPSHHPPLLAASSPAPCSCTQGCAQQLPPSLPHPFPAACWCLTPRPQTDARPLWVEVEGKHSSSRAAHYTTESSSGGSDITGGYSMPVSVNTDQCRAEQKGDPEPTALWSHTLLPAGCLLPQLTGAAQLICFQISTSPAPGAL